MDRSGFEFSNILIFPEASRLPTERSIAQLFFQAELPARNFHSKVLI